MPVCFQLTPIGETEPAKLQQIDDTVREAFGAPPDVKNWYRGWYNTVGFGLAMGRTFDELAEDYASDPEEDERLVPIVRWLQERYTTSAWRESRA